MERKDYLLKQIDKLQLIFKAILEKLFNHQDWNIIEKEIAQFSQEHSVLKILDSQTEIDNETESSYKNLNELDQYKLLELLLTLGNYHLEQQNQSTSLQYLLKIKSLLKLSKSIGFNFLHQMQTLENNLVV